MKITIRPARAKDLEAIHGLIKTYAKEKRLIARSAAEIKKTLKNFFLAEIKCKGQAIAIGCAALEIYSSKLAEVRSLAVHPDYKGVGAGRALVKACVERAHKRRVLEVMAITSSEAFFNKLGFHFALPHEKKALFLMTR
jgi:amino-acid N-acetyltransferase